PLLVGQPVGSPAEVAKEGDVGTGRERAPTGAGEDEDAQAAVGGGGGADLAHPVGHLGGERIVGPAPSEGDDADGVVHFIDEIAILWVPHRLPTLLLCS